MKDSSTQDIWFGFNIFLNLMRLGVISYVAMELRHMDLSQIMSGVPVVLKYLAPQLCGLTFNTTA